MRSHCPHIPCMFICNKIDINPKSVTRKYQFIQQVEGRLEFVSAADGTNVVKIFKDALEEAVKYKENPHEDDLMGDIMDLLEDPK